MTKLIGLFPTSSYELRVNGHNDRELLRQKASTAIYNSKEFRSLQFLLRFLTKLVKLLFSISELSRSNVGDTTFIAQL